MTTILTRPIVFPEGTTDEQRAAIEGLAERFRATSVDVTQDAFDLSEGWLYVVVHPLHGGDFHAGVDPDGGSHS